MADIAPEPHHAMIETAPLFPGQQLHEVLLHSFRCGLCREAQTVADALDMCIHCQALIESISPVQHDIGRFPGNTRQGRQFCHTAGDFSLIDFRKATGSTQKVARLAAEKACAVNNFLKFARPGLSQFPGAGPAPEQLWCNRIDTRISTLCRQYGGNQQLPCITGNKMGLRGRIACIQRSKNLCGTLARPPG